MVDFTYYKEVFLGEDIGEEAFPKLERQAVRYLQHITKGKGIPPPEGKEDIISDCICALAEYYQVLGELDKRTAGTGEQVISSESVGGYAVSYDTSAQAVSEGLQQGGTERQRRLYSIAKEYLAWTGLLYRGVL